MDLYIGLMSGTSMDGIDAALVELPSQRLLHGITIPYKENTQAKLLKLCEQKHTSLEELCQLNTLIGQDFARAVHDLLDDQPYAYTDIKAIGSHGQTIVHDAFADIPYTLQLGCPHTISSLTGITVVADFRTRDIVNKGQGAPFAPLYHQELFAAKHKKDDMIAVVNIGGISNISLLSSNQHTRGWDIGPGNCLMDQWMQKHYGLPFDKDGLVAKSGVLIPELLERLAQDPYFSLPSPKSIGKEYFSLDWLSQYLEPHYSNQDVLYTLAAFTAQLIAQCIQDDAPKTKAVYLCGGGAHHPLIVEYLQSALTAISVMKSSDLGVSEDFLEAMMLAWLAYLTMNGIAVDLREITGSNQPAILGAIYPAYNRSTT